MTTPQINSLSTTPSHRYSSAGGTNGISSSTLLASPHKSAANTLENLLKDGGHSM